MNAVVDTHESPRGEGRGEGHCPSQGLARTFSHDQVSRIGSSFDQTFFLRLFEISEKPELAGEPFSRKTTLQ